MDKLEGWKKVLAALIGSSAAVAPALTDIPANVQPWVVVAVGFVFGCYLLGQGLADFGKAGKDAK